MTPISSSPEVASPAGRPRRRGAPALALLVAAACAVAACGRPARPGWRAGRARVDHAPPATFAPAGRPAARYDGDVRPAPATPLGDAIARAITDAAAAVGKPAPAADGRLYAVATELAAVLHDGGAPPYDAVEFALSHHGVVEPSPQLLVVQVPDDDPEVGLRELRPRLPQILAAGSFRRLGVGAAAAGAGVTTVVVALQESHVDLDPVPRELPRGGSFTLRGAARPPYVDPRVYVTGVDGGVATPRVVRKGERGFRTEVACGPAPGRLKVEVIAHDAARSPTVLANFPVWCGEEPPRSMALARDGDGLPIEPAALERDLLRLANEDRARAGLPPLVWDARAAAIARAHSEEMRDDGYVSHVSPKTGSAAERARAGGLRTAVVLENLARAYSPAEAQKGLMNSPGHRANLLSREVSHMGIGVAVGPEVGGRRELYVTQLFYRVNDAIDLAQARTAIRRRLVLARQAKRLPTVALDEGLERIADAFARDLASGVPLAEADRRADRALAGTAGRYRGVITLVAVVANLDDPLPDGVEDPQGGAYGLGVAQGDHPKLGDGAIYVVVLMAHPRGAARPR